MTHNPELDAAAYLAGELSPDERSRYEDHLLGCDECWTEVEAGRSGMLAAARVREFAPAHLRERIRDEVATEAPRSHGGLRSRVIAAAAAVAIVAGGGAGLVALRQRPAEPATIAAAVAGYRNDRLPGAATPHAPAPDLRPTGLTTVGAGAGRLGDHDVDAYAFRDGSGRTVMVYIGKEPFPMPTGGHPLRGPKGPWITSSGGVMVLCARFPHELLVVGMDEELVQAAAHALDVM